MRSLMRKITVHKRTIAAIIAAALVLVMVLGAAAPFLYR